jgi:hypothetical protein
LTPYWYLVSKAYGCSTSKRPAYVYTYSSTESLEHPNSVIMGIDIELNGPYFHKKILIPLNQSYKVNKCRHFSISDWHTLTGSKPKVLCKSVSTLTLGQIKSDGWGDLLLLNNDWVIPYSHNAFYVVAMGEISRACSICSNIET